VDYRKPFRVLRAARNLSQKELAARMGVTPTVISLAETGARKPSREVVERAARALGVSLPLFTTLAMTPEAFAALTPAVVEGVTAELLSVVLSGEHGPAATPPPPN